MTSRDVNDLHPTIKMKWFQAHDLFKKMYSSEPEPIITCTHRSCKEQDELYAQGRTVAGKIVTNAKGGQSNHNYLPSPAFDIAFKNNDGSIDWNEVNFERFASIAKGCGLEWGGDWHSFKDKPHFEISSLKSDGKLM